MVDDSVTVRQSRGLWRDAWRQLRRNRAAMIGALLIFVVAVLAIAAPAIAPYGSAEQDSNHVLEGVSLYHPFGTDNFGRDIFSRVLYGARISLSIGVLGVALGLVTGGGLGLIAGHWGGWLDDALMRLLDLLLAFPQLLLAIMVTTVLGGGDTNVIVAMRISSWTLFARVVSG